MRPMAGTNNPQRQREKEAADTRRRAAQIARETEQSLRNAHRRTRAAVAAVLAEQRQDQGGPTGGTGGAAARAWARRPSALISHALATGAMAGWSRRAGTGATAPLVGQSDPRHSTFHFKLSETHSGPTARAHQGYIERESACVSSFGTLGETQAERLRAWEAIAERSRRRTGTIRVDFSDDPTTAKRVLDSLPRWTDEGLLTGAAARRVAVAAREVIQSEPIHEQEPDGQLQPDESETADPGAISATAARMRRLAEKKAPKTCVTFWIEDPSVHKALHDETAEWFSKDARQKRLRSHAPRATIVQRRLVLELAHEIDDDARERCTQLWCQKNLGGAGVSWHAAIHAPENNNDSRNYHAHIVYSEFELERDEERPRWTFEAQQTLPKSAPLIQTLSGNGTQKRKGAAEKIRQWRADWANTQNEELAAIGAMKRYDPRSYKDQGRGHIKPGKHRGTVQSAIEQRGDIAGPTTQRSDVEWDRLAASLVAHLGIEDKPEPPDRTTWAECLPENVRTAFEALRIESGGDEQDKALAAKVADRLDDKPEDASPRPAPRHHEEAVAWLRALRKNPAKLLELEDPPELARWRRIERTVLDPAESARLARQIVEGWDDDTRKRAETDPRAEVRRLHSAGRRAQTLRERWTAHLHALHQRVEPASLDEQQINGFLSDLDESGVSIIAAIGRDAARQLATTRTIWRMESAIRDLSDGIINGHDNERCAATMRALQANHRRTARRFTPEETRSFKNRFDLLEAAIAIRKEFQNAADSATPRLLTATANALSRPVEDDPRKTQIHSAALGMLRSSERTEIARAAQDSDAVMVSHRSRMRLIANSLKRLGTEEQRRDDPGRVDSIAGDNALRNELHRLSPSHGHVVDVAIQDLAKRRYALSIARMRAERIAEGVKKSEARGLARLKPADAAELYGVDPPLFRMDHPDLHEQIVPHISQYARVAVRTINRITEEAPDPDDAAYRIAHAFTAAQYHALRTHQAPAGGIIERALTREALAARDTRRRIRDLTESLTRERLPAATRANTMRSAAEIQLDDIPRSQRLAQLHTIITHPRTASRLTRRELRLAARRAGIFGAPRAPQAIPERTRERETPETDGRCVPAL